MKSEMPQSNRTGSGRGREEEGGGLIPHSHSSFIRTPHPTFFLILLSCILCPILVNLAYNILPCMQYFLNKLLLTEDFVLLTNLILVLEDKKCFYMYNYVFKFLFETCSTCTFAFNLGEHCPI